MSTKNPCVSICEFNGRTGWCAGCGRTLSETRAWRRMSPRARTVLLSELPRRVERLRALAAPAG